MMHRMKVVSMVSEDPIMSSAVEMSMRVNRENAKMRGIEALSSEYLMTGRSGEKILYGKGGSTCRHCALSSM